MNAVSEALVQRGQVAVKGALRRGGERVANLERRPVARRATLVAIPAAMKRMFDPAAAAAGDLDATLELRVVDGARAPVAQFGIHVAGGRLTVTRGAAPEAGAQVTIAADDLVRMGAGAVSWPELLAAGRLEMAGDPFLALRFPRLFRLPAQ
jgi:hypothetical protein